MAQLSGNFNADFSSFTRACEQAVVSLTSFQDKANLVQGSVNKVADSLSGVKIAQQAEIAASAIEKIGGVSRLTNDELIRMGTIAQQAVDKFNVMGEKVPANIQNLADRARGASEEMLRLSNTTKESAGSTTNWSGILSTATGVLGAMGINATIGGVIDFTKEIVKNADAVQSMAQRLGISAEAVQGFKIAAEKGGTSIDTVGSAVMALNRNLAEGDKSTIAALDKMGLKFQNVRAMKGEDAFVAVTNAAAKMTDGMEQAKAGTDLLGKGFSDMLPAIKAGFGDTAAAAEKMSNDTIASLARLKSSWDDFANHVTVVSGTVVAGMVDATTHATSNLANFSQYLLDVIKYGPGVAAAMAAANQQLDRTVAFVGPMEALAQGTKKTKEETEAAAKSYADWKAAMVELDSAGTGWKGTLDTIDGSVVEAIRYYLEAGVSQDKLAAAYALTATQVKAVDSAMKAEILTAKELAKAQADADAIHMQTYANTMKTLESVEAANEKTTGGYRQRIEMLAQLDAAELELAKSVYAQTTSEKDRMKIVEDSGARHTTIVNRMIELDQKQLGIVNAAVLANLDAQTKLNAAYGLTASGGIAQQETAYTKMTTALDTLHQKKVEGIEQTAQENLIYKQYTDALLEAAQAEDKARDGAAGKNAEIAKTPGILGAATAAMQAYQGGMKLPGSTTEQAFGQSYLTSPTGNRVQLGPHGELPDNWFDLYSGKSSYSSGISNLPRFASGVENFAGGLALVGERGPELVNLPGGSDVIPRGGFGGGITNNVVIHVNGTAAEVAQKVAAELMRTLKSGQQLTLR
jgi:hypothetical protein